MEVAHLRAVLLLLAQIVGVEWLVLLLEHLEIGLVVALELILLLLLSSHFVVLFLVHVGSNYIWDKSLDKIQIISTTYLASSYERFSFIYDKLD